MRHALKFALKPAVFAAAVLFSGLPSAVLAENPPRVTVLELLTSANCPDTPPANTIFNDVVRQNDETVIAFSCHVTYFDLPNENSALSKAECDQRHQMYLLENNNAAQIPSLMIDGIYHTSGAYPNIIESAIRMSKAISPIMRIPMTLEGGVLTASMPDTGHEEPLDIWLIAYTKGSAAIPSRECANPQFANYATHAEKIFQWDGDLLALRVRTGSLPAADGYILLAQKQPGNLDPDHMNKPVIVAAGRVALDMP